MGFFDFHHDVSSVPVWEAVIHGWNRDSNIDNNKKTKSQKRNKSKHYQIHRYTNRTYLLNNMLQPGFTADL